MIINLNVLDKILIILVLLFSAVGAIAKLYQYEWLFLVSIISIISIFLLAAVSILQILRTFQKQIINTGNVIVNRLDSLEKAETDAHAKTLNVIDRKYTESSDLLKNQLKTLYNQVDSLFSLFSTLKIRHPLPIMRGWPISPDFANTLISIMLTKRPKNTLSLGSGISDLIIAYCIEKTGSGRLVSLDHDDKFARETQANLEKHQLSKYGQVFYAPLKKHQIKNEDWLWYDIDGLIIEDGIDLLIIDGPLGKTQALARYPALPLLNKKLSNNVTIILDDANRTDEKEIIDRWIEEYPDLIATNVDAETGCCIISRDISKKTRS